MGYDFVRFSLDSVGEAEQVKLSVRLYRLFPVLLDLNAVKRIEVEELEGDGGQVVSVCEDLTGRGEGDAVEG